MIKKRFGYLCKRSINMNHRHDNIYRDIKNKSGRRPMTQIIAAKANKGLEVILISDRMVTRGDQVLSFEHDAKMDKLGDYICVLSCGSIHEPEIIEDSKKEIMGHMGVRKASEIVANKYALVRRKRIECTVLSKYGLMSYDDWYNKQRLLQESTNEMILQDLNNCGLEVHLLIAGIDEDSTSHIYTVGEPGICHSYDELGFCCAGSGQDHAETVFAMYSYKQSMTKEIVLQISYIAKKRAELATGIGPSTDAWILDTQGIAKVLPETIDKLEKMYRQQKLFIDSLSDDLEIKTEYIDSDES